MNVAELYEQVAQLGFETSLEDGTDRFYHAAGRALLQINALRPRRGVYDISHVTPRNEVRQPSFAPFTRVEDVCFEAEGIKAYYFECDGVGAMYIEAQEEDGTWSIIKAVELRSKRSFKPYRGFVKRDGQPYLGTVRFRFTGEFVYAVRCVALYSALYGAEEDDIPTYAPYTPYNIGALAEDFMTFCSPPIKEEECSRVLNQAYRIEQNSILMLPYGEDGFYRVHYNRRPKQLINTGDPDEDMMELDLDADLSALMPLLTAAYIWAEDEPELAEYYLTLYRERAAEIVAAQRNYDAVPIKNVYGW
jgi:hypothetical protein